MRYLTASTEVTLPTPTSASKRRTLARVCSRSATAVFTEMVVFPTPPFGAKMLITRPSPMIVPSSAVVVVSAASSPGRALPDRMSSACSR